MDSTHKPTLCVVAGPNGSGKTSTTIQLLANEWLEGSIYINPNNIAQEQFGDYTQQTFDISVSTKRETSYLKPFSLLMRNLNFYARHTKLGSLSVSSLSAQAIQKSTYHASQKDTLKVGMKSQYQRSYHDNTSLM